MRLLRKGFADAHQAVKAKTTPKEFGLHQNTVRQMMEIIGCCCPPQV